MADQVKALAALVRDAWGEGVQAIHRREWRGNHRPRNRFKDSATAGRLRAIMEDRDMAEGGSNGARGHVAAPIDEGPVRVRVAMGRTIPGPAGSYKSQRVDVSIDVPCAKSSAAIESAYTWGRSWAAERLDRETQSALEWLGD
jgi:hypothetical protein